MNRQTILWIVGMALIVLGAGCAGDPAVVAIPSAAVLPTLTNAPTQPPPVTAVRELPTWTPVPTEALSCSALIDQTKGVAQQVCGDTAAGEACLVSPGAALSAREVSGLPSFAVAGDRVRQTLFNRITTAPYDAAAGTWGMALLRSSDRPDAGPYEATTALLYGDATVFDVGSAEGPFRSIYVLTGGADPWCDAGPLPGVLLQSGVGLADTLRINTLEVRFQGTLLVRVPTQAWMELAVLAGRAEITTVDGGIFLEEGSQYFSLLGGDFGYTPIGIPQVQPLSDENRNALPLVALPRTVAVSVPVRPTVDTLNQIATATPTYDIPATITPSPTPTPFVPFEGQTAPGGVYLTFEGKRIEVGGTVSSAVPVGGSDRWVFTPRGYGPNSADAFEIIAVGTWDPIITIESATFGVYEPEYDGSEGQFESYRASLAGSGGDWRITIRDADGGGGPYTIRYSCLGPCVPPE